MKVFTARDGSTPRFRFLRTQMALHADAAATEGQLGLIEQVAPAGFAAPPHIHHGEDEAFFVVAGSARFHRGSESIDAGAGSFIWLPRDVPHWFEVGVAGPATLLQLNTPAGLERFFVELGTAELEPEAEGPLDAARLLDVAARYNIEMLPPRAASGANG